MKAQPHLHSFYTFFLFCNIKSQSIDTVFTKDKKKVIILPSAVCVSDSNRNSSLHV